MLTHWMVLNDASWSAFGSWMATLTMVASKATVVAPTMTVKAVPQTPWSMGPHRPGRSRLLVPALLSPIASGR